MTEQEAEMAVLKIGQLAKLVGCTVKTVRFYEANGLLPRPARSSSGYRLYREQDLKRLQFIQRTKVLGLPLSKIRELVLHLSEEECACSALRPHLQQFIREQLKDVEGRLDQLSILKEELKEILSKITRAKRALPEELCVCCQEPGPASAHLLRIQAKGGSR